MPATGIYVRRENWPAPEGPHNQRRWRPGQIAAGVDTDKSNGTDGWYATRA
jgi:hypothetical protein